jgi:hypothetical protein
MGVGCTMLRKAVARQHREGQQVAAAKVGGQRGDARVGQQIGALHVHMGDAGAAGAGHLIARADHVAAGTEFDLGGPAQVGHQRRDVQRQRRERADRLGQRDRALGAHTVQRDRAWRDRRRMAVLQPQHHALVVARGGQARVAVGRPGVGVVGAGQAGAVTCGAAD